MKRIIKVIIIIIIIKSRASIPYANVYSDSILIAKNWSQPKCPLTAE